MSSPLVVHDVSKSFGSGDSTVRAVDRVSFQVEEGEVVVIIGPSGCGKTTLLSMLGCLLRPTSGEISILGEEVTGLSERRRARFRLRHIGFVFQSFNLISALNATENVEIALNLAGVAGTAARRRVSGLFDLLELTPRATMRPNDMSGGEQQRLAIARALANRPDIILADEPTASLDSHAGRVVMELMQSAVRAGETKSLIVVTHDMRILDVANRVLAMEDGVVREVDAATIRQAQANQAGAPGL
ncbi:MAG: ABC transporter ATP-binding protein [Chloroflexi bacterium]|jgi:putative ABC transport system ATP-binding protein|nr:ABC transporter ATP-binding protein [Chloroflexota bacterium]MCZ7575529.1 ABC transporter ATP-binding protein [Dehalococcoidia bacterium]NJD66557.1 ABC transporter ATP-binding protein [Chloroflexota bacterium]PWB45385.1 MAG: ABC transporter ATP-binding protein [Dehalococcoidia bacterium]